MLHAHINENISTYSVVAGAVIERSDALGVGVGACPPLFVARDLQAVWQARLAGEPCMFYHALHKSPSVPQYAPTDPNGPRLVHAGTCRQGGPARR